MPALLSQIAVPVALGLAAMFAASADDDDKPKEPPKPDDFTPPALDFLTEVRMLDGQPVRYFRPQIQGAVLGMLQDSYLMPAGDTILAIDSAGQKVAIKGDGVQVLNVVPKGRFPDTPAGVKNAAQMIAELAAEGYGIAGTLNLPVPQEPLRQVVVVGIGAGGTPRQNLALVCNQFHPYAVLLEPGASAKHIPMPDIQPEIPPGKKGPVPSPPPVSTDDLDATMPASLRAMVQQLLAKEDASTEALEDAAADLEAQGFPKAAAKLRARAAELKMRRRLADEQRGYTAFLVRSGDLPSIVAQHYTGDGGRWHEIKKNGIALTTANLAKKWMGEVQLPLDWNATNKPLPPVAHGAPPQTAPSPPVPQGKRPKRKEAYAKPPDPNRPGSYPHPDRDERSKPFPPDLVAGEGHA